MILAIDIGNTHVVIGLIDNGNIKNIFRLSTNPSATGTEYAIKLRQVLEFENVEAANVEGAIISSVVPPATRSMQEAVKRVIERTPITIGAGIKTGLNIRLDDPSQMGADLVAGAVGAISKYEGPLIVLDLGTATTLSVIDENKNFLGGAIVPGVNLSINALANNTSLLYDISIEAPKKCIGSNTVDSMKSGAILGHASLIDGMIERIEDELGKKTTVIATGGLSSVVIPNCKHTITYDRNLLLDGLWTLYEKNKK